MALTTITSGKQGGKTTSVTPLLEVYGHSADDIIAYVTLQSKYRWPHADFG